MNILATVTHTHDTGVALLRDGEIACVIEEERLNRRKKTWRFPRRSLQAAMELAGLTPEQIDAVTYPWHTYYFAATVGWLLMRRFPASLALLSNRSHPTQRGQILFGHLYLARRLRRFFANKYLPPVVPVAHHDAHAASAFLTSPFEQAIVLNMDGYGDRCSTSAYIGRDNRLKCVYENRFFDSLGMLYTVLTEYLGFLGNRDEGKVMGLAAYGRPRYAEAFRDMVLLGPDGRYSLNRGYFDFERYGQLRPFRRKFYRLLGPPRRPDQPLTERHADIAASLQTVLEETILHIVRPLLRRYRLRKLCLSGGTALNCLANARILAETDVEEIFIPPNPSDTGVVLGSALYYYNCVLHRPRVYQHLHAFHGLAYGDEQIERAFAEAGLSYRRCDDVCDVAARMIADGKIVGWFQGRFEMGPRALGNRSILADPRRVEMKDILNARVKHRESFRPFAPSVLQERASEYFFIDQPAPFMTIAPRVRPQKAHLIPAVVHVDGTARVQTVAREDNPLYHRLISSFERLTGVPVLLNTSFNRQEPIVASPADALSCYLRTQMDAVVLGDYISTDRSAAAEAWARQYHRRRLSRRTQLPPGDD